LLSVAFCSSIGIACGGPQLDGTSDDDDDASSNASDDDDDDDDSDDSDTESESQSSADDDDNDDSDGDDESADASESDGDDDDDDTSEASSSEDDEDTTSEGEETSDSTSSEESDEETSSEGDDDDPVSPNRCLPKMESVCKVPVEFSNDGAPTFDKTFPEGGEAAMQEALCTICSILFKEPEDVKGNPKQVSLKIYAFDGVANASPQSGHINFSSNHIENFSGSSAEDAYTELFGVLVHEGHHLFQASNTGPGGMVEGMADYVRIRAELYGPNRKPQKGGNWDSPYTTGGFFFSYLHGANKLHDIEYSSPDPQSGRALHARQMSNWNVSAFQEIFGKDVSELWNEYQGDIAFRDPQAASQVHAPDWLAPVSVEPIAVSDADLGRANCIVP
jgi:hypothetical protein